MVKIKTKKKLTLPELIQWGWDNGEEQISFRASNDGEVCFHDDSWVTIETAVEPDETFTVEVEEEITEDTVIPKLANYYVQNGRSLIATRPEKSISEVLNVYTKGEGIMNLAFYILNDDYTMTLLWKNGGMVE
ncbi:hypothetical protein MUA95_09720 [Staphylococcus agnetis]|uniref:Uncharacterized protein n=1 Tax=Staphylococcus agnetis TaxID=985762 RepID=A0ABD7TV60_9STAP|nr:hypothetical protein [Staphylococcus agnetis]UXU56830.1 hypothetical protein MUA95_09720 [Staphylococcus agnetis]